MKCFFSIVASLFCGMLSAAAADTALPAVFRVAGLDDGDVLNVREGPSTGYGVIATLPDGALVEVTARSGDGWGRILQGEGDGWVALRHLRAQNVDAVPAALYCGGTEPFWSVTMDRQSGLQFSEPGQDPLPLAPDWQHAEAARPQGSFAIGAVGYTAVFHRRDCSDGMSDRTYGWVIDFLKSGAEGFLVEGCCRMLR